MTMGLTGGVEPEKKMRVMGARDVGVPWINSGGKMPGRIERRPLLMNAEEAEVGFEKDVMTK